MGNKRLKAVIALNVWSAVLLFCSATKEDDRIVNLPGLTYTPNFAQYSGYLPTQTGNLLHYWLVESQRNPAIDPLVLWLNGGPGCSSLGGFLQELGPFRPNRDGKTLYENVFSWNKYANVLFLESPRDIGFSYRNASDVDNEYNDVKTAVDNVQALASFFDVFTEYRGRDFYITGESYAGVYVPTLTDLLIKTIQNGTLAHVKLAGMAVGNGELSEVLQINSAIELMYYRGVYGQQEYESLKNCCQGSGGEPLQYCDFSQFITLDSAGNAYAIPSSDPIKNQCGILVEQMGFDRVWNTTNDVYNTYQDCYMIPTNTKNRFRRQILQQLDSSSLITNGRRGFVDQGSKINMISSDSLNGFPCWMSEATATYLNLPDVRLALHIPANVQPWQGCNYTVNDNYIQMHNDTTSVFDSIIASNYSLRILIYNGDVDTVCNFLGDEWFVEQLAKKYSMSATERWPWNYTQYEQKMPRTAGFWKSFSQTNLKIDLLTIKGGGHFAPTDRPGPSLAMIVNFMQNTNYSTFVPNEVQRLPLLQQYRPREPKLLSRKEADRVLDLPGLTYEINFNQYSGYLRASTGNYLHYWLIESQTNPISDPLVLWLNGGPGCSSLGGLITELGPFHPNPDGKTLFENVYSWNKAANLLFLEAPRNIGFSYQNKSENTDGMYNDTKTAYDNYLAIADFFTAYPEYRNRQFFVTGESYGGVYVPTLTALLIQKIQSGELQNVNLVGMAVGNGELSGIQQINSAIDMLYFHGFYGKREWDSLKQCCPGPEDIPLAYCDFSQWITLTPSGDAIPRNDTNDPLAAICGPLIQEMGQLRVWLTINDVYNIYQDCYQQTEEVFGSRIMKEPRFQRIKADIPNVRADFVDQGSKINYASTDSIGAFTCYASAAATKYLNGDDVRRALNIPDFVQAWQDCNLDVNAAYIQQYNDTTPVFEQILNSGYPLRMLIYNGDLDNACNFLGDEWFVEALAEKYHMNTAVERKPWMFRQQIAGYWKQFSYNDASLAFMTVKGAGHLVPTDRPGPAFQMFLNFLRGADYGNASPYATYRSPLYPQYQIEQAVGLSDKSEPLNKQSKKLNQEIVSQLPQSSMLTKEEALISDLPGLTYTPTFKQYSGYLEATPGNNLHYWLTESQTNPSMDPLILWLNGGPGCSSLSGFMNELGPFRPNPDGVTLFENVYSWNKVGNVLFLEAPRGVGFSYRDHSAPVDNVWNDEKTAIDSALALQNFLQIYPEYCNRDFYITGESYAGIYIPTLTDLLIKMIQNGSMPCMKLKGVAIGNGELSEIQQINSAVDLLYFRGIYEKKQWDELKQCCTNQGVTLAYCNFAQYITLDSGGNAHAIDSDDPVKKRCGILVEQMGFDWVWNTRNDVYNTYQDCYRSPGKVFNLEVSMPSQLDQVLPNKNPFIDQGAKYNYDSTDANGGFSCYSGSATRTYLNLNSVQQALHISDQATLPWSGCSNAVGNRYFQQHNDTTAVFDSILASGYPLKFLIYNGDADTVCNFLGDEWFMEALSDKYNMTSNERMEWNYTQAPQYLPRIAGYQKSFTYSANVKFDLLTVKGAGHFVPTDRPGPALNMIYNFINDVPYSSLFPRDITRQPLKPQYQSTPAPVSRANADRIYMLPGLTYNISFAQYSGYLRAAQGNYLHYWFVHSQGDRFNDPVVLWLNGGPGCSSLGGLMIELGPFRPNPDGATLYENVFSWNKRANILFLESPRNVGFSYQNFSINNDYEYDDNKTADDAFLALQDWFHNVFPEYQNRDFYVAGESYGGIYVPTLTSLLIKKINAGDLKAKLVGMLVGNGRLSNIQAINSNPDIMYFRGFYGQREWDSLKNCCRSSDLQPTTYCNYSKYVDVDRFGDVYPNPPSNDPQDKICADLVAKYSFNNLWDSMQMSDVYNMYQDCYGQSEYVFGSSKSRFLGVDEQTGFIDHGAQINYDSTDSQGGFQCYMTRGAASYLNQVHVRDAIHIPDYVQDWSFCSEVGNNYTQLHRYDMTPVFDEIIASGYPLRILIYNGDTDTSCSIFEAEWFTNALSDKYGFASEDRDQWTYQYSTAYEMQIGGWFKKYRYSNISLDLLTIKGAGHMVPTDRPGPSLQMFDNFLNRRDYSTILRMNLERSPLLPQYQPLPLVDPESPSSTLSTAPPAGTTSPPAGTTAPPAGTTSLPTGTTAPSAGTTSLPTGTTSLPTGTTSLPTGTTSLPTGITAPPAGTTSLPTGITAPPAGTTSLPTGITAPPAGTTSLSTGTAAPPAGTTTTPHGSQMAIRSIASSLTALFLMMILVIS